MGVFLIVVAVLFLFLGGVSLFEALAGGRGDAQPGAALFAAVFLGVAIVCLAFGIGHVATSTGRRRCPSCARRIPRRAMLCPHCHRAVPSEE